MIYLDNAATTKPSETAVESVKEFLGDNYFNPSALYREGLKNHGLLDEAREFFIKNFATEKHDIIFNSCGSEADNQAVFCAVKRGTFITTEGEHSAIYKSFSELKARGLNVIFAKINRDGSVSEEDLYKKIKENPDTSLVSVVHVNNETGAINDISKIATNVKNINKNILFHSDGVQAFLKVPYRLSENIDMYSVSAHKINALKGTGALFYKKNVPVKPLVYGGGQEEGLRSGTENIFGIKLFEAAAKEHLKTVREDYKRIYAIKNEAAENLDKELFTIISDLSPEKSSPYILAVSAKGLRGEVIMHSLEEDGIIVGNGSACSSKNRYSRVLTAAGYDNETLDGVVRLSFSNATTSDEVSFAIKKLNEKTKKLCETMKG